MLAASTERSFCGIGYMKSDVTYIYILIGKWLSKEPIAGTKY
jgi:hypothetical protein